MISDVSHLINKFFLPEQEMFLSSLTRFQNYDYVLTVEEV
jgi:hypothetical protein